MALQSSGPISISNIKAELSSASNSLRALSSAAGKSTPDSMSEFYGFANEKLSFISFEPNGNAFPTFSGGAGTSSSPLRFDLLSNSSSHFHRIRIDPLDSRYINLRFNFPNYEGSGFGYPELRYTNPTQNEIQFFYQYTGTWAAVIQFSNIYLPVSNATYFDFNTNLIGITPEVAGNYIEVWAT